MNIGIFALHFGAIALGAGATFITDLYFLISARTHVLPKRDIQMLMRLNFAALFAVVVALITDVSHIGYIALDATNLQFSYWLLNLLFMCIVFLCLLSFRKLHLPTLLRHQQHHAHLSDTMIHHSTPLVSTSVVTTFTWMFVIVLTSLEYTATNEYAGPQAISFLILYCLVIFSAMKLFNYLKDHITRIHTK